MQNKERLEDRLERYCASNYYPFHMPGHKRQSLGMPDPYRIDITEIHGFDNLNHPEEILLDLNHQYRNLYRADDAWLTVNGSTGGNLAAIFAGLREGCGALIQRNSHKSVYHALMLKHCQVYYQMPKPWTEKSGPWTDEIPGLLDPEETERILTAHPEIRMMVITSPSYEGVLQDVRALAAVCHAHGTALIVDAAHGAHLGIGEEGYFPDNPIHEGADVVILSLHKMLPAMTQTSMVLYNKNDYIKKEDLEESIRIFQTSSPSYVFMDGASRCIHLIQEKGDQLYSRWKEQLETFYKQTKDLRCLQILPTEGRDPSKIVICSRQPGVHGADLMQVLRNDYHLELEMAQGHYALAMTSFMDTEEGMERLTKAVLELDRRIAERDEETSASDGPMLKKSTVWVSEEEICESEQEPKNIGILEQKSGLQRGDLPEKACELWQAADQDWESVLLENAEGRAARDELCVYPPGIPLAVPGERITGECVDTIRAACRDGLEVDGLNQDGLVRVLCDGAG